MKRTVCFRSLRSTGQGGLCYGPVLTPAGKQGLSALSRPITKWSAPTRRVGEVLHFVTAKSV